MIPTTINTKTLSPAMQIKPGLTSIVNMLITIILGKTDVKVQAPTDMCLLIDNSGSTGDPMPEGLESKMDKIKEAADKVIANLRPTDRLCIVTFNYNAELVLDWVNGDDAGKSRARTALWNIRSGGGTNFASGLQMMLSQYAKTPAGREKRGLFLTDGQDGGSNRVPLCTQLKDNGATVFFGGLGVRNEDEQKMVEMAEANGVRTNFRGLTTADDVLKFFEEVAAAAATTVIKNAMLKLVPIEGVRVLNLEYVLRHKQLNYASEADASKLSVNIGDMGVEETFDLFCCLNVTQGNQIVEGMNSFGKIQLMGEEVGATGGQCELKKGYLRVQYVKVMPTDIKADAEVKEIMGLAAAQRELAQVANTTNPAEAAKHIANAQDAIRKTQAFNRGDALKVLAGNLAKVQQAAASSPEGVQQAARRATQAFSAADRAKALAGALKKN